MISQRDGAAFPVSGGPSPVSDRLMRERDTGTMRRIHLDEPAVIAMYEQVENTREVAAAFNVSDETIRRALKRNGISRTHRHPKPEPKVKLSHCRTKCCPALIVMLGKCMGYRARAISEVTGYKMSSVQNVLSRRGLVDKSSRSSMDDYDLDEIEREYVTLGIPGRQLDRKYGLGEGTISTWMRRRGIVMGKGAHQEGRNGHDMIEHHKDAERKFAERLRDEFGGRFEYVCGFRANGKKFATVRCAECGTEFDHYIGFQGVEWQCPRCEEARSEAKKKAKKKAKEKEREADAQRRRKRREVSSAIRGYELALSELRRHLLCERTCPICGSTFHPDFRLHRVCCSHECSKKYQRWANSDLHRHRAKRYGVEYDNTISLAALFERDGGTCQICGGPCDWDDREWGDCGPTYPSIDHIVPFAQGGEHTWDNVQLAHHLCNSRKGTKLRIGVDRHAA